ncbi:MAG: peptidase M16 [Myxococcales bacterium]|nr:peptidase M16 [Myxococcales bacterium]|tara:strand:- start:672 stop:2120 length:1449 start_codon:yes stop_codon:yes gene_type:complete
MAKNKDQFSNRLRAPLLISVGLLLCGLLAAPSQAQGNRSYIPYEKYRLDNGLEVILHQDDSAGTVAVSMWAHVGGLHEAKGRSGFAHLFEHLMFQGTPHVGDDKHFSYLQQAGASSINGTTSFDRTNYFEVVPAHELELALWLESDRLGWLMESVDQAKLDEQREVVKNERLQRVDNQPYGLAQEKMWQAMFLPSHPYYGRVIGSMSDLDAATMDDVKDFFGRYYAPSNMTLTVAGNFDVTHAKNLIEKYFATIPAGPKPDYPNIPKPSLSEEVRVVHYETLGKLPRVMVSYFTPPFLQPGDAEMDILAHVLAGTKTGRLRKHLMELEERAQSVHVYQQSMQNVSVFTIDVVLRAGESPEQVLGVIDSRLSELYDLPPEEEEIARAIATIETDKVFGLQALGGNSGRAEQLQRFNHYTGEPDGLAADLERYRNVTSEKIIQMMEIYLTPKSRGVLFALPKSADDLKEIKSGFKKSGSKGEQQ